MSDEPEPPTQASRSRSPSSIGADQAEALFGLLADPPPEPEPPAGLEELRSVFPQYEIFGQIGRGGMGVVYKARHKGLDRLAAIKLLPPELGGNADFVARFQREARAMARLEHPNIITVYDFGQTPSGQPYFVMEFIDGANLADLIHSGAFRGDGGQQGGAGAGGEGSSSGPVPKLDPLVVAAQLCEALAYAHGEGIVHRDIKPANVMVDRRGRVKVADFGLARIVAAEIDATALTTTGTVMGTLDYMAPEQRKGMQVDQRADIYSLGVMVYEMFCGEVPHGVFEPPSSKVKCDPRIDAIVSTAMQNAPERRYQSTVEMKAAVDGVRTPLIIGAAAPFDSAAEASGAQMPVSGRSRRSVAVAVPVLVLLLAAGSAWWFTRKPQLATPDHSGASVTPADSVAKASPPQGDLSTAPLPIKLWDASEKLPPDQGGHWENGAVRLDRGLSLSSVPSRDAILRASIRMEPGNKATQIALRVGGAQHHESEYLLGLESEKGPVFLQARLDGDKRKLLASWPLPRAYAADEWARLELRVVGDSLTASLDGAELGTVQDRSVPGPGGVLLFTLGSAAFRDIEYVPLDKLEPMPPVAMEQGAIRLWDAPGKIRPSDRVRWEDGAVRLTATSLKTADEPSVPVSRDGIIRAEVRLRPDAPLLDKAGLQISLRVPSTDLPNSGARYMLTIDPQTGEALLQAQHDDQFPTLAKWPLPLGYRPDEWLPIELRVIGDELTVLLNGRVAGKLRDTSVKSAGGALVSVGPSGTGWFRNVVYVPLDGGAAASSAKLSPPHPGAPAAPAPIKLWEGAGQIAERVGIWKDGRLHLYDDQMLRDRTHLARNSILRAKILAQPSGENIQLGLRDSGDGKRFYFLPVHPNQGKVDLARMVDGRHEQLASWPLPRAYKPEEWISVEFRAVDDTLTVLVDGNVLGSVRDTGIDGPGGAMLFARRDGYFRDIEFVPMDPVAPAPKPRASEPAAIKLWDAADKLTGPFAHWEDNAVRIDQGSLMLTQPVSRDAILRASVKFVEGGAGLALRHRPVGTGPADYYMVAVDPDGEWHFDYGHGGKATRLAEGRNARKYASGEWAHFEMRIIGDEITYSQEGQVLGTWHDTTLAEPGGVMLYASKTAYFRDVGYVPLDAAPRPGDIAVPLPAEAWHDYLDGLRKGGALVGHRALSDDGTNVSLLDGLGYDLVLANDPPALNAAVRVRGSWERGQNGMYLKLRCQRGGDGKPVRDYQLKLGTEAVQVVLFDYEQKTTVLLREWSYPQGFDPAADHIAEFRAVNDRLTACLDGQTLGTLQDSTIAQAGQSIVCISAGAQVRTIETLHLP